MKKRLEKLWHRSKDEILELMKGEISLFDNITNPERKKIAHLFYKRSFLSDEIIFKEGSLSNVLYLLMSGEAIATHLKKDSSEGQIVLTFSPGENILLSTVLTPANRPYSLIAKSAPVFLALFDHDLEELLNLFPKIGVKLLYNISSMLSKQFNELGCTKTRVKGK